MNFHHKLIIYLPPSAKAECIFIDYQLWINNFYTLYLMHVFKSFMHHKLKILKPSSQAEWTKLIIYCKLKNFALMPLNGVYFQEFSSWIKHLCTLFPLGGMHKN